MSKVIGGVAARESGSVRSAWPFLVRLLVVTLCVAAPAGAQYFADGFEAYAPGPLDPTVAPPPANGGWGIFPLYGGAAGGIVSSTVARNGAQSFEISNNVDAVVPFSWLATILSAPYANFDPTPPTTWPQSGVWRLSLWCFVPSSFPTGTDTAWVLVQNVFEPGGIFAYMQQTKLDLAAGTIDGVVLPFTNGPAPLPFDAWFHLRMDYDLDNDCRSYFLNDELMATGPAINPVWTTLPTLAIAQLDLFTEGGTYFVDDVSLTQLGGAEWQVNHPDASLSIGGVQASPCAGAITVVPQGTAMALTWGSSSMMPFETSIGFGPAVPASSHPTTAFTPGGQVINVDLSDPSRMWLNGGASALLLPFPAPGFSATASAPAFPVTASAQFVIADPTVPVDAFRLSQAVTWITP